MTRRNAPPEGLQARRINNADGTVSWSISQDGIWQTTIDAPTRADALRWYAHLSAAPQSPPEAP